VARAQLTLADGGQAPVWRATSDETGHYRFASIPAGRFSLDARLAGFAPSNQDVTVSEQPLALDVSLRIGGAMEVITVTATSGGGGGNPRRWRKQAWVATSGRLQKPGTSSCCIRKR
jgi:hypothetical protein